MTEQKHSPKPWEIFKSDSFPLCILDSNKKHIASVHKIDAPEDQAHANARLIIAAPENHVEHKCLLLHVQRLLETDWAVKSCHDEYLCNLIAQLNEQAVDSRIAIAAAE